MNKVVWFLFVMGCVASFEKAFYDSIMLPLELIAGFGFDPVLYLQLDFSLGKAFICFKKQREKTRSSLKQ